MTENKEIVKNGYDKIAREYQAKIALFKVVKIEEVGVGLKSNLNNIIKERDYKMKESQCGPCGLYCGACGATDCGGCLSDLIDDYVEKCKFRDCAGNKNIDFCCYCSEYPCNELNEFMNDKWPHHWTIEPNLDYIKKNGKKKWLNIQKQKWSCKSCGAEIKWYQQMCSCGRQLKAWDVSE